MVSFGRRVDPLKPKASEVALEQDIGLQDVRANKLSTFVYLLVPGKFVNILDSTRRYLSNLASLDGTICPILVVMISIDYRLVIALPRVLIHLFRAAKRATCLKISLDISIWLIYQYQAAT